MLFISDSADGNLFVLDLMVLRLSISKKLAFITTINQLIISYYCEDTDLKCRIINKHEVLETLFHDFQMFE